MPKGKFPEAEKRMFDRVFICMNCGAKIRTDLVKIRSGKVNCRKCKKSDLRPIKRQK